MVDRLEPGDPRWIGQYQLVGYLGGGMSRVFLGRSPGGRPVAVKLIQHEYGRGTEFRRRFAREVEAARRVGGHFTAQVIDSDPQADPPWMVTAYIPGPSLRAAVRAAGPLPVGVVRRLGAALAEGLSAIHAYGLVHRDVKPDNVVLGFDGPRIIDFGIARALDASTITAGGSVFGTFPYMSPEQASGHPTGPASDVFSLGSVLTFAAAGHAPFGDGQDPAVLHRIINDPPDLDDVPAELRDTITTCLDKDPARRIALVDVLRRFGEAGADGRWPPAVTDMIGEIQRETDTALSGTPAPAPPMPPGHDTPTEPPSVAAPGGSTPPSAPSSAGVPPYGPGSTPAGSRPGRRTVLLGGAGAAALAASAGIGYGAYEITRRTSSTPAATKPAAKKPTDPNVLTGHAAAVTSVAFSPDGRTIASASDDHTILLWSVQTRRPVGTLRGHTAPVTSVAYSADWKLLVSGGGTGDGTVRLWDATTRAAVGTLAGHTEAVRSVACSPDGDLIASGGDDRTTRLWSASQRVAVATLEDRPVRVNDVLFGPDGSVLLSAYADGKVRFWVTSSHKKSGLLTVYRASSVNAIAMSGKNVVIALGVSPGAVNLWDGDKSKDMGAAMTGTSPVNAVAWSPDGKTLAVGLSDGQVLLWSLKTRKRVGRPLRGHHGIVSSVAFSPDGKLLASASADRTVRLWKVP